MDNKMSVHDQMLILDKIDLIKNEISYYDEDSCPEPFNVLYNSINDVYDEIKEIVKENIKNDIGELTEESFKNILLS